MKTSKRLILLVTVLLLTFSTFAAAFSVSAYEELIYDENVANGDRRVFDFASLLSDTEINDLETQIDEAAKDSSLDIVVVTVNDTYGKSNMDYADDFYDYNGFGYGANNDGVLLLVNMDSRTTWISTCGKGIEYLTDSRIEKINDHVTDELGSGNYFDGISKYVDDVKDYVGSSFKLLGMVYRPFTVFVCVAIALVIGLIYYCKIVHSYKFNGKTDPYAYRQNSTLHLTNTSDVLVDTNIVTTRIERSSSSDGGSSTHTSSSGTSHGGGGGSF